MDSGGGARGDEIAGTQRAAAARIEPQSECQRRERAAAHRRGITLADHDAIDAGFTMQQLETARLPVGNLHAQQQARVVTEVACHDRGAVVVDVLQRAARDFDAGIHGFDEATRCFRRPINHIRRRVFCDQEYELRFDRREAAREYRRVDAPAAIYPPQGSAEYGPDQSLRAELLAEWFGDPPDLPAGNGVVPERNGFVLAAIRRLQVWRPGTGITVERARAAPRFHEFSGDSLGIEGAIGESGNQFLDLLFEHCSASGVI